MDKLNPRQRLELRRLKQGYEQLIASIYGSGSDSGVTAQRGLSRVQAGYAAAYAAQGQPQRKFFAPPSEEKGLDQEGFRMMSYTPSCTLGEEELLEEEQYAVMDEDEEEDEDEAD